MLRRDFESLHARYAKRIRRGVRLKTRPTLLTIKIIELTGYNEIAYDWSRKARILAKSIGTCESDRRSSDQEKQILRCPVQGNRRSASGSGNDYPWQDRDYRGDL